MTARLFWHVASTEARKRMSYRADFWINTVFGFAVHFSVTWFLWRAMFAESGQATIRGFSFDAMVLYYFVVIMLSKVVRGQEFEGAISTDIYEGALNRYLVYPVRYAVFKFAQTIGGLLPLVIHTVLFTLVCPLVIDVPAELVPSIGSVLMASVSIAAAVVLHFAIIIPIQAVAFWADNVWSLVVALRFVSNFLGGLLVPLALFPDWSRGVIDVLPFRFLFSVPTRTLLGQVGPQEWAINLAWTFAWILVIAAFGRAVWKRGDLQYSGVGI